MNSDARRLPLSEVQVGMIVSNSVFDSRGEFILKQGSVVTEAILRGLQRRGIETLGIVAEAGAECVSDIDREAARERQRQRLAKLFRRSGDGPADKLLLRCVTQYRLEDGHE